MNTPGDRLSHQLPRFALVGLLGLLVDTLVLYACLHMLDLGFYTGRLVSFMAAVSFTWYANRRYTFTRGAQAPALRQWLRFVAANSLGGAVNYLSYAAVVALGPPGPLLPFAGVAVGSAAGLVFNFTVSRQLVFRPVAHAPPAASPGSRGPGS